MPLGTVKSSGKISQEESTKGWKAAYETRKLMGSIDWMGWLKNIVIIMLLINIIGAGAAIYTAYSTSTTLNPTTIAGIVSRAIANQTTTTVTTTVAKGI